MKLATRSAALVVSACVFHVGISGARADVLLGDWENGSADGWIDWGTQNPIAAPKYEWSSFGATRGNSAIKVIATGYNQNLALKLQNVNLSNEFFNNNELAIDFSFPAETNAGWAQIFGVTINAQTYGWHDEGIAPKFTYGFPNGGPQTTTVRWDYHRLVDGIASNGEVPRDAQWIEFILATNSDATHGTFYFDNARIARSTTLGDFNEDGAVDALDIDLLLRAPNGDEGDLKYDVNADNQVISPVGSGAAVSDSDYWVTLIKGTRYGDVNLDKKVNFDDLLVLAQNYGSSSGTWAVGDFDGNNNVTFDDLLVVAQNYGFAGVVEGASAQFNSDWMLAQSMVPEPASLAAIGALALVGRRRR